LGLFLKKITGLAPVPQSKSMFKNAIICILTLMLLSWGIYHQRKVEHLSWIAAITADSLRHILLNKDKQTWKAHLKDTFGLGDLGLGDTLLERHHIVWTPSRLHFWDVRLRRDSTVFMIYRKCGIKNPLTKEGRDTIYKESTRYVPLAVFKAFKKQLASVSFMDVSRSNDFMCCFGVGGLDWECTLSDGQRYKNGTWCNQSLEFKRACEVLMQLSLE
jgi:hypothetical protein